MARGFFPRHLYIARISSKVSKPAKLFLAGHSFFQSLSHLRCGALGHPDFISNRGQAALSVATLTRHEAVQHGEVALVGQPGTYGGRRGIEALRQYRRGYGDKLKDWRRNPLHDWTSHGADALRTFACGYYEPTTSTTNPFRRRPP